MTGERDAKILKKRERGDKKGDAWERKWEERSK